MRCDGSNGLFESPLDLQANAQFEVQTIASLSSPSGLKPLVIGLTFEIIILSLLTACAGRQAPSTAEHHSISLEPRALRSQGKAFITPPTTTGQEQDKQTLAFIFAQVLVKERPNRPCVTRAETLSSINRAGLTEEYKLMYQDY